MKLEIELENFSLCNGCPCFGADGEIGEWCNLNYWGKAEDIKTQYKCIHCGKYVDVLRFGNEENLEQCDKAPEDPGWHGTHCIIRLDIIYYRPVECIRENGV